MYHISETIAEAPRNDNCRHTMILGVENETTIFRTLKAYRRPKEILEDSKGLKPSNECS